MKNVIKHGKPPITIRRFVCASCGCVFDADDSEYTRSFNMNEEYCISSCPECWKDAYSII